MIHHEAVPNVLNADEPKNGRLIYLSMRSKMKLFIECDNVWFLNSHQIRALFTKTIALGLLLCVTGITTAYSREDKPTLPHVIPRPKIEKYDTGSIPLAQKGEVVFVHVSGSTESQVKPIQEGLVLLSDRLGFFGARNISLRKAPEQRQALGVRDWASQYQNVSSMITREK